MRQHTRRYRGTRLFEILQAQGRRQNWFARQVGCSQSLLSMIKGGRRPIPEWLPERASAVLGIPVDVLFFDPVLSIDNEPESCDTQEASRDVA